MRLQDHTTGLRRDFAAGEIVCTPISAALLIRDMRIPAARVRPVPLDEKHNLDGVDFTFMDANHCPGAAMILFEVPLKDGSGRKQVGPEHSPKLCAGTSFIDLTLQGFVLAGSALLAWLTKWGSQASVGKHCEHHILIVKAIGVSLSGSCSSIPHGN